MSNESYWDEQQYLAKPVLLPEHNKNGRAFLSFLLFIIIFYFVIQDIVAVLLLAVIVFFHELGHYCAMKIFNYKNVNLLFVPLVGAMVTGTKKPRSQRESLIVSLAGPLPGIFLGIALFYYVGPPETGPDATISYSQTAAAFLLLLNLFNLLPFAPLDGGRLLEMLFTSKSQLLTVLFLAVSVVVITAFCFFTKSYILLILPFFLLFRIRYMQKSQNAHHNLDEQDVEYNRSYDDLTNRDYWLIRDEMIREMGLSYKLTAGEYTEEKEELRIAKQVEAFVFQQPVFDLGMFGRLLVVFFWILPFITTVLLAYYWVSNGLLN